MPVDHEGRPRTAAWAEYAEACAAGRPWAVREETWLTAYMQDLHEVCAAGLDAEFYSEADAHADRPDLAAAPQAHGGDRRGAGDRLLGPGGRGGLRDRDGPDHGAGRRAALHGGVVAPGLLRGRGGPGDPRPPGAIRPGPWSVTDAVRWSCFRYTATAWTASGVYRRGIRQRDRGCGASDEGWPLLARVLGDRVREVHPLVVRFYTNPAPFDVKASLRLNTIPAKFWSRLATLFVGQGPLRVGPGRDRRPVPGLSPGRRLDAFRPRTLLRRGRSGSSTPTSSSARPPGARRCSRSSPT